MGPRSFVHNDRREQQDQYAEPEQPATSQVVIRFSQKSKITRRTEATFFCACIRQRFDLNQS
jgi:hypothetical protein